MNTLAGKRIKHLTFGRGARESVSINDGGEILIEFRHIEAKNKKKNGKIVAGKTEHPQPEDAWMNSHPKKPDSRFRGNPVQEIAVWRGGKEADDRDKDLVVIHHHRGGSARSDIDEIAEDFIKSKMDAFRKRALNIGPDHSK